MTYFESFCFEHEDIKKLIGDKNFKQIFSKCQIFYDSIMYGCFCIETIEFVLNKKSLIDFTSLFWANDFRENDKNTRTIPVNVKMCSNRKFM